MPGKTSRQKIPAPGTVVAGKYRIERVIGEGGMGVVFAAHHVVLDQRVAMKILYQEATEESGGFQRFLNEAKATARLKSEHVTRVMDAGNDEVAGPFIVMEILDGCDFGELLKLHKRLEVADVADAILQACEALAHAHSEGIIHRDIKPSNLFLALLPDGSNVVKIVDFGISKFANGSKVETLTGKNIVGSPGYMSPEQVRSARSVDPRSDVWSLGIVAYELLTGRLPFDGEGVGELLAAILEQDPKPLATVRPDVPVALSDALARCLRKNRDTRFADVGELARAIAPFASPAWAPLAERVAAIVQRTELPPVPVDVPRTPVLLTAHGAGGYRIRSPRSSLPISASSAALSVETAQFPESAGVVSRGRTPFLLAAFATVLLIAGVSTLTKRSATRTAEARVSETHVTTPSAAGVPPESGLRLLPTEPIDVGTTEATSGSAPVLELDDPPTGSAPNRAVTPRTVASNAAAKSTGPVLPPGVVVGAPKREGPKAPPQAVARPKVLLSRD
ncbi:MAG: protein kinase [Polyangiaceae bacterium]